MRPISVNVQATTPAHNVSLSTLIRVCMYWLHIADLCRPVTSVSSRQRLRSLPLVATSRSAQLLRDALRLPCIRCGGPKGMEPAAGAFTDTRDNWPLQDGIKDLSSLHPVTVTNCLPRRTLVITLFMLRRVRNCRRYYYYYIT